MLSRQRANSILKKMGSIDQQDFKDLLSLCLTDEVFKKKIKSELGFDELTADLDATKLACKKKDDRIRDLERIQKDHEALLDALEQYSRRKSIRVTGIGENETECLYETCLHLFNDRMHVSPKVQREDFDRIHRLGKPVPGKTRPVLVKFATYQVRDRVWRAKAKLKPADPRNPDAAWKPLPPTPRPLDTAEYPPLNPSAQSFEPTTPENVAAPAAATAAAPAADNSATNSGTGHMDTGDVTTDSGHSLAKAIPAKVLKAIGKKIYLNDDLTSKRDFMLFVARQAKRKDLIHDVWVTNGMIKMKDINNTVQSVRELKDIPDHGDIVKEAENRRPRSGLPNR